MKIKVSKKEYQEIEIGDNILLTYKGVGYMPDVQGTSIIATVLDIIEDSDDGIDSPYDLHIEVINDNADPKKCVHFPAGHKVSIGVGRFCKYVTFNKKNIINEDYIELIRL